MPWPSSGITLLSGRFEAECGWQDRLGTAPRIVLDRPGILESGRVVAFHVLGVGPG